MKVAYIGLGSMGAPQARLLAGSDAIELAVFDVFPEALNPFEGTARIAASPADAAIGAAVACVCVRNDQQVEDAILGSGGLAEGLGTGTLILVHSTIKIETVKRLGAELAKRGITLLDAPVSRTRRTDDQPFVTTMVGGSEEDYERAKPVITLYSTDVQRVGELGTGMALKIANNMFTWVSIVMSAKLVQLAEGYDIPIEAMKATMRANGNLTPTMDATMAFREPGQDPAQDAFRESQTGIGEKDLALAIDIGEAVDLDMSAVLVIRDQVREAMTGTKAR